MSDSQKCSSPSKEIPPCPLPLVDILKHLGKARSCSLPKPLPDSDEFHLALMLIERAALDAHKNNKPFTKEYLVKFVEKSKWQRAISNDACILFDNMDAKVFGEMVVLIEWICCRINERAGIPIDELRETIERLAHGRTLDWQYTERNLNHVAAKLRELDSDKTTAAIWCELYTRSPYFRRIYPPAIANDQKRLRIDPDTFTITFDAKSYKITDPKAFSVYQAIWDARPNPLTKAKIQQKVRGCNGKNKIRQLLDALPPGLGKTVQSGPHGYWIDLAPIINRRGKRRKRGREKK